MTSTLCALNLLTKFWYLLFQIQSSGFYKEEKLSQLLILSFKNGDRPLYLLGLFGVILAKDCHNYKRLAYSLDLLLRLALFGFSAGSWLKRRDG